MFRRLALAWNRRQQRIAVLACLLLVCLVTGVVACNIPVFRYALERWKPDACEIIVFHDGPLSSADMGSLAKLQAIIDDGQANAKLIRVDVAGAASQDSSQDAAQEYRPLWAELQQATAARLPHVLLRSQLGQGQLVNGWHGDLSPAMAAQLVDSPAREEIRRRLLAGHSIVWVLLAADNQPLTEQVKKLTESSLATLPARMRLPDGIGLPGSELYAEVPLVLQFSLLQIDPQDPQEAYLSGLLKGLRPEAVERGEPLLVPVFGRGRALEVIPGRDVSARLIEDLTLYLSGACSCQVKEQNPGFDLLMRADWDGELFGDAEYAPPDRSAEEGQNRQPGLLKIPPGRKP